MEQTAIQELIQEMEQLKQTKLYQGSFKAIEDCMALAYHKLEKEKTQIIDARYNGRQELRDCGANYRNDIQYYNETFKK